MINSNIGFKTIGNPRFGFGGIDVAPPKSLLLISTYLSEEIKMANCLGGLTLFGTLPGSSGGGLQRRIGIAPSNCDFKRGDVYVTRGQDIYSFPNLGGNAALFVNIAAADTNETGITFDTIGNFGGKMIVTSQLGKVWTVDKNANITLLADTGTVLINPVIPPNSFGTYGGQIWVADYNNGAVHAINSSGTITYNIISCAGATSVAFVPFTIGSSGTNSFAVSNAIDVRAFNADSAPLLCTYSYFAADLTDSAVHEYQPGNFSVDSILITSGFGGGIILVTWNGTSYDINFFDSIPNANYQGGCGVVY